MPKSLRLIIQGIMFSLILFLVTFVVVFLIYLLFVIRRGKYLDKFMKGKEINYLKKVYKIKIKESDYRSVSLLVALTNSFIIATSVTIVSLFKNIFLEIIVGFITVMALILICYHIIGKIYQKEGI